jgi:hypothetical protein
MVKHLILLISILAKYCNVNERFWSHIVDWLQSALLGLVLQALGNVSSFDEK